MVTYRIVVETLGTVVETGDMDNATGWYRYYVGESRNGWGKVRNSTVTLFAGEEIAREHVPHDCGNPVG